uniref:Uncharacterized protein n=1 Tax=Arundo donax TaxID=35708 RepID=A0A0A9BF27_ARUDO
MAQMRRSLQLRGFPCGPSTEPVQRGLLPGTAQGENDGPFERPF